MEFTEQRWLFWGPLRWFRHRHVALLSAKENNWTGLYVSSLQLGLWHVVTRFSDVKLVYERPWRSCQGKSDGKYRRMSYVSPIFLDEIPLSPKWSVIKSYKIIIFLDDIPFETPVFSWLQIYGSPIRSCWSWSWAAGRSLGCFRSLSTKIQVLPSGELTHLASIDGGYPNGWMISSGIILALIYWGL